MKIYKTQIKTPNKKMEFTPLKFKLPLHFNKLHFQIQTSYLNSIFFKKKELFLYNNFAKFPTSQRLWFSSENTQNRGESSHEKKERMVSPSQFILGIGLASFVTAVLILLIIQNSSYSEEREIEKFHEEFRKRSKTLAESNSYFDDDSIHIKHIPITLTEEIESEYRRSPLKQEKEISLEDVIKKAKMGEPLVIVGSAGMGKSRFCHHLVSEWNSNNTNNTNLESPWSDIKWLFWIPLGKMPNNFKVHSNPNETLEKLIRFFYFSEIKEPMPILSKILENPQNILLVFDGLNELKLNSNENDSIPMIRKWEGSYRVILTSRPEMNLSPHNKFVKLQGFKAESIQNYINSYFSNGNRSPQDGHHLIANFKQNSAAWDLAKTPLYLYLICKKWEIHHRSSPGKPLDLSSLTYSKLYHDFVAPLEADSNSIIEFYEYLAFLSLNKGILNFNYSQLEEAYKSCFKKQANNETTEKEVSNETTLEQLLHHKKGCNLITSDNITDENKNKLYYFAHPSFQEYLAARYIAKGLEYQIKGTIVLSQEQAPLYFQDLSPSIIREQILIFLQQKKFSSSHFEVWPFVAGYLLKISDSSDPNKPSLALQTFFDFLYLPPRDLVGIYELGLFTRCLNECEAPSELWQTQDILRKISFLIDSCLEDEETNKKMTDNHFLNLCFYRSYFLLHKYDTIIFEPILTILKIGVTEDNIKRLNLATRIIAYTPFIHLKMLEPLKGLLSVVVSDKYFFNIPWDDFEIGEIIPFYVALFKSINLLKLEHQKQEITSIFKTLKDNQKLRISEEKNHMYHLVVFMIVFSSFIRFDSESGNNFQSFSTLIVIREESLFISDTIENYLLPLLLETGDFFMLGLALFNLLAIFKNNEKIKSKIEEKILLLVKNTLLDVKKFFEIGKASFLEKPENFFLYLSLDAQGKLIEYFKKDISINSYRYVDRKKYVEMYAASLKHQDTKYQEEYVEKYVIPAFQMHNEDVSREILLGLEKILPALSVPLQKKLLDEYVNAFIQNKELTSLSPDEEIIFSSLFLLLPNDKQEIYLEKQKLSKERRTSALRILSDVFPQLSTGSKQWIKEELLSKPYSGVNLNSLNEIIAWTTSDTEKMNLIQEYYGTLLTNQDLSYLYKLETNFLTLSSESQAKIIKDYLLPLPLEMKKDTHVLSMLHAYVENSATATPEHPDQDVLEAIKKDIELLSATYFQHGEYSIREKMAQILCELTLSHSFTLEPNNDRLEQVALYFGSKNTVPVLFFQNGALYHQDTSSLNLKPVEVISFNTTFEQKSEADLRTQRESFTNELQLRLKQKWGMLSSQIPFELPNPKEIAVFFAAIQRSPEEFKQKIQENDFDTIKIWIKHGAINSLPALLWLENIFEPAVENYLKHTNISKLKFWFAWYAKWHILNDIEKAWNILSDGLEHKSPTTLWDIDVLLGRYREACAVDFEAGLKLDYWAKLLHHTEAKRLTDPKEILEYEKVLKETQGYFSAESLKGLYFKDFLIYFILAHCDMLRRAEGEIVKNPNGMLYFGNEEHYEKIAHCKEEIKHLFELFLMYRQIEVINKIEKLAVRPVNDKNRLLPNKYFWEPLYEQLKSALLNLKNGEEYALRIGWTGHTFYAVFRKVNDKQNDYLILRFDNLGAGASDEKNDFIGSFFAGIFPIKEIDNRLKENLFQLLQQSQQPSPSPERKLYYIFSEDHKSALQYLANNDTLKKALIVEDWPIWLPQKDNNCTMVNYFIGCIIREKQRTTYPLSKNPHSFCQKSLAHLSLVVPQPKETSAQPGRKQQK